MLIRYYSLRMAKKEGKKVLVIEDDRFLVKAYEAKLKGEGFSVSVAHDGEEGIAKIEAEKPDIILLDLIMPRMDGFDVLEEMQKHKEWKKIPVLILTNLGQEDDRKRGLKLGAKDYIVKADYSLAQIVDLIKKHS